MVVVPEVPLVPTSLAAAHVGRRVVVRHRLPDGSATDLLGELLEVGPDLLRVLPDDGPTVRVPAGDVVAAKVVPPRQVRPSSSIADVARVQDLGWPGLERERLGGWVLRAGGGFTGRANSALPLGDPGTDVASAVDHVERWYRARDLPPRVSVASSLDPSTRADPAPEVDAELDRRGWSRVDRTLVLVADLRRLAEPPPLPRGDRIDLADEPDEDWLGLYRYRGGSLPAVARQVLLAARHQEFLTLRREGRPVACGRVSVARGWAGVTAMEVDASVRRQGLGSVVLAALLAHGARLGARWGYLQVSADNEAGRALYAATGFVPHHAYHYRLAP